MATVTVTTTTSAESAKLWEVRDEPKDDQDTSMTEVAEEIIVEEHYETAIGDTHPPKDARPSAETGSGIDELTKQMSGVHLADERQPMTLNPTTNQPPHTQTRLNTESNVTNVVRSVQSTGSYGTNIHN